MGENALTEAARQTLRLQPVFPPYSFSAIVRSVFAERKHETKMKFASAIEFVWYDGA